MAASADSQHYGATGSSNSTLLPLLVTGSRAPRTVHVADAADEDGPVLDAASSGSSSSTSRSSSASASRSSHNSTATGKKRSAIYIAAAVGLAIAVCFSVDAPEELKRLTWKSDGTQAFRLLLWFLFTIAACVLEPFPLATTCILSTSGAVFLRFLPVTDEMGAVRCSVMNPAFMRALPQGLGIESGRELGYYMGLRDSLAPEVVAQSAILSAPDLPFTMCKKWASAEPWTPLVGFANSPLWLIVLAFMLSACMKKSGLAKRLGLLVVSNFAGSVLQLGYCVAVCEVLFGALIPSNTARGAGIILPILLPLLKETLGSDPEKGTERRAGTYLVLLEMALNNKLSQVFPTASANSALIMSYARDMGESIDYMQWVRDLSVHMLLQILLCPLVLYLLYRPTADDDESTTTQGAAEKAGDVEEGGAASGEQKQMNKLKAAAAQKLGEMGPLCRDEIVTMGTLLVTIFLWAAHGQVPCLQYLDTTMIALGALGVLLASGVVDLKEDVAGNAPAWNTFIWFGVLVMMSGRLQKLGVFAYIASKMTFINLGAPYPSLLFAALLYGATSYFFASTTARVAAMYKIFVQTLVTECGVPQPVAIRAMACMTGTGYLTPYSNAVNVPLLASGYVREKSTVFVSGLVMLGVDLLVLGTFDYGWWWGLGLMQA